MLKKQDATKLFGQNGITKAALAAIEAGEGTRAYGTDGGIQPGDVYILQQIDFRSTLMRPTTLGEDGKPLYPVDVWNAMSDDDKAEAQPRATKWFEFITDGGTVSFGALLGHKKLNTPEFWEGLDGEDEVEVNTIEGFDPTQVFMPSKRTAQAWMEANCDGLLGKRVKCVATKSFKDSNGYDRKYRAFIVLNDKEKEGE